MCNLELEKALGLIIYLGIMGIQIHYGGYTDGCLVAVCDINYYWNVQQVSTET